MGASKTFDIGHNVTEKHQKSPSSSYYNKRNRGRGRGRYRGRGASYRRHIKKEIIRALQKEIKAATSKNKRGDHRNRQEKAHNTQQRTAHLDEMKGKLTFLWTLQPGRLSSKQPQRDSTESLKQSMWTRLLTEFKQHRIIR